MLLAGIVDRDPKLQTVNLINSILSRTGRKISVIDSKSLAGYDPRTIRDYVNELNKNHVDFLILNTDILDVQSEVFDYLRFDIIIFSVITDGTSESRMPDYNRIAARLFSLLDEKGIAIVNVDDNELIKLLHGMKLNTVTYGFNSKAGVTASSIGDMLLKNEFICCLQSNISTLNGLLVEPQEFRLSFGEEEPDVYDVLAAVSFALVNDIDLNMAN